VCNDFMRFVYFVVNHSNRCFNMKKRHQESWRRKEEADVGMSSSGARVVKFQEIRTIEGQTVCTCNRIQFQMSPCLAKHSDSV
jgi:hypothetical protein